MTVSGKNKSGLIVLSAAFSFFFIFAQLYGAQLSIYKESTVQRLLLCAGLALVVSPGAAYFISLFIQSSHSVRSVNPPANNALLRYALLLLLAWFPVFLAYYPGLFTYDAHTQLMQYLSRGINAWHPPLHTLWLGIFCSFGRMIWTRNVGFAMHILSQMTVMAFIFAYSVRYLRDCRCPRWACRLLLLFYAVFPVHSILSISCTKDVIFTGMFLLFSLDLHRLWQNPGVLNRPLFWVKLILLCVLMCLMRNNASYALIPLLPLSALLCSKRNRRKVISLLTLCFILSFGAYQCMQKVFENTVNMHQEMMSIPCQQLARVAVNASDADSSLYDQITSYIPNPQVYIRHLADPIKKQLILHDSQEVSQFIRFWLRTGMQHPLLYLDAFAENTQGLWRLNDITHTEIYGKGLETRLGYLLTNTASGLSIEHTSYFPQLEALYESLFSANNYLRIPVLSKLFSPALYFWLMLLIGCRAIYQKQKSILILVVFLSCYVLTLLLGPCVLVRYCYPLFVAVPLLLILTLSAECKTGFESCPSESANHTAQTVFEDADKKTQS